MPATFAFAPDFGDRPINILFDVREDLKWKVATQLKQVTGTTYSAPNLQYFMDSPTEISDYSIREFTEESNGKKYTIRVVLHAPAAGEAIDKVTESTKKIVAQEKAVIGELPDFDYGTYTFLICYMPQATGDGMEHRNSTYVCGITSLKDTGVREVYGTLSHEFFHCWNVERIRPASLEPFNFEAANMSGELWFAEGFTNYYEDLILCRAGLIPREEYVEQLSRKLNYVSLSPSRTFRNPIEMSQYAPFADAATAIDPVNKWNTFVSYYYYGEVLALALDLSLRNLKAPLTLDDFMARMWTSFGKHEKTYSVKDIEAALSSYAGEAFAANFFNQYIYQSNLPDYSILLSSVGVSLTKLQSEMPYLGIPLEKTAGGLRVTEYTTIGSAGYVGGIEKGDKIISVDGMQVSEPASFDKIIAAHKPGDQVSIIFERHEKSVTTNVKLNELPFLKASLSGLSNTKANKDILKRRDLWLSTK